jgi:hypothetical protein
MTCLPFVHGACDFLDHAVGTIIGFVFWIIGNKIISIEMDKEKRRR